MTENSIILGDCLEIMKAIKSKSIDMILCDLPYGMTHNKWDSVIPLTPLWEAYTRIIKDHAAIVLTASQPFTSQLITSNLDNFRHEWIWKKNKSTGFLNAKKAPLKIHESVLVFGLQKTRYFPQKTMGHSPVHSYVKNTSDGMNYGKTKHEFKGGGSTERYPTSIIFFPVVNNYKAGKIHPNQKPIELFEYLIKTYSKPKELVLDTCSGSGTTAIAASNTNRRWLCIEKDAIYYKKSCERIKGIL